MDYTLNELERRVLGVLIEKSMAQPTYYPMTVNAIVAACNQKSNRDPIMELDDEAVWSTLEGLRKRELVQRILPSPGSRADKFKHDVAQKFGWESPQRAVMTELMLRGPQTVGELRTRCARMTRIESVEAAARVLDSLMNWTPPVVVALPRGAGQSAVRFDHLLYPPDETPAHRTAERGAPESHASASPSALASPHAPALPHASSIDPTGRAAAPHDSAPAAGPSKPSPEYDRLRDEVEALQAELADFHETVAELTRRLENLERAFQ
jgi:hypothetical protein